MRKILFKNFSWSFIGSSIYAFSQWLLILIIAKFGGSKDVGIYSLGLAISAPMVMLINLNFRALQSTGLSSEYGFSSFKKIRLLGNVLFMFIFTVTVIALNHNFEITISLFLIALSKMIESFSELHYGLFQYNERLDLVSQSSMLRGVIGAFGFGVGYYFFGTLSASLLIMLIVWLLNLLLFDYRQSKQFIEHKSHSVNKLQLLNLVKIGLPLGLISFMASLNVNIPRIVFENYLTLEDLGYFTAIFYLVLIIGKFMTSLSSAVLPRLARLYEGKRRTQFLKVFNFIIIVLFVFSVIIILFSYYFGDKLLLIIYGKDYSGLQILLILIMVYGLFNYLGYTFEMGLNAMRAYSYRLFIEVVVTIAVFISSIYFIPHFGLNGGAIALIISSFVKSFLLAVLFTNKYLNKQRGARN